MTELHLRNAFVVSIIIIILFLIFFANVTMPALSEKMICGLEGGQWDKMLHACAFDPKACEDAGGIPTTIPKVQNEADDGNSSNATALLRKFE